MGNSCYSSMDTMCGVLVVVVVVVLIYLGCSEIGKAPSSATAARRATTARATVPSQASKSDDHGSSKLPDPRRKLEGIPLADAFQQFDVDQSLHRIVPDNAYAVPDDVYLQDFIDGDKSTFRPVDKEAALKSANTRPAQHMKNGRDNGTKARTVGLSPNEFVRRTLQRPVSSSTCVAFNDTDTRHVLVNEATNCFESESCPWQQ